MADLLVCTSCHPGKAVAFIARLAQALPEFQVGGTTCMSGCIRPGTIAFRGTGKASYLFGDIDPDGPIADIVTFGRLYADIPDGWIEDARSLGNLRTRAIARIPVGPDAPTVANGLTIP